MSVSISIPANLLAGIFDECDKYENEETGGRLLGFFTWKKTDLRIDVSALLGPGPNARRTRISFFQDGEYQERLFRGIEARYPEIRHLGNWHTHHVNGLDCLSNGDCETYRKNVNSPNHAQDFFYALLVTKRTPGHSHRYAMRHYIFVRHGQGDGYEVSQSGISITQPRVLV